MHLRDYPDSFWDIEYRGMIIGVLNDLLALRKNLSPETVIKIKETHVFKHVLLVMMKEESHLERLPVYEVVLRNLLFYQQKLWGFDIIESFHDWSEIPHCTCPTRPRGYIHTIDSACPVHHKRYCPAIDKYMAPILDKKISSAKL